MNLLVCGESYTGKTTIGKSVADFLGWEFLEVSSLVGEGSRDEKSGRGDYILAALQELDPGRNRVIAGLREMRLLPEIGGDTFLVYISSDEKTRAEFFIKREGKKSEKLEQAKLIDNQLGVTELVDVADLHFVVSSHTAHETALALAHYMRAAELKDFVLDKVLRVEN